MGNMIADLRLLPRPFYLLMAGSFINRFGHFVIPFLAIYLRQLGFAPAVTGYTLGAYGGGGFCASILGGYLTDRIGRKPTLLISCFGAAIAMILLAFANSIPSFIAGAFLTGLMTNLYYPASSSLTADLIGKELRVRAFAVQRLVINLATACGLMTAGLVAASSFVWLFIADAATTAYELRDRPTIGYRTWRGSGLQIERPRLVADPLRLRLALKSWSDPA